MKIEIIFPASERYGYQPEKKVTIEDGEISTQEKLDLRLLKLCTAIMDAIEQFEKSE